MSRGKPNVSVRLDRDTLDRIERALATQAWFSKAAPMTLSDFIRKAVHEKLAHSKRSRKAGYRRRARLNKILSDLDISEVSG
jgi:hypothetical protein